MSHSQPCPALHSRRALEDLESGALDVLISPGDYVSSVQPADVLSEDTFTCAVWAGNTAVGTSVTLEEY